MAFSPALVVKVIASAHESIRLAGYSFTSPSVVKALLEAKRRGVDVRVLVDDKGNRGAASRAAMRLVVGGQIPMRVISMYAIHHDKYIVVDGRHTQTGSFNYSERAATLNSENVIVVWSDPEVAKRYIGHFEDRWRHGVDVEISTSD